MLKLLSRRSGSGSVKDTIRSTPLSLLHALNHLALYSTDKAPPKIESLSLSNYLVQALGFSQHQSVSTSNKLSRYIGKTRGPTTVSKFSSYQTKADLVITFLKKTGLTVTQIQKAVSADPRILTLKVDKTLKPKINSLSHLGFSRSDLAHYLSVNPTVLCIGKLSPVIDALREILGSDYNVISYIKRPTFRHLGSTAVTKYFTQNVRLLEKSYGIPREKVLKFIGRQPLVFTTRTEVFSDAVLKVQEKWGIDQKSGMFMYAIFVYVRNGEEGVDRKCRLLKSFGWTDSDVLAIIQNNPYSLSSSEEKIQRILEFYMTKLGYAPAYLASHPALFTYSLDKRVAPRHRVLQVLMEKGLLRTDHSLYEAVRRTESKFLKRYIHPYMDVIPGLRESYIDSVASAVVTTKTTKQRKSASM